VARDRAALADALRDGSAARVADARDLERHLLCRAGGSRGAWYRTNASPSAAIIDSQSVKTTEAGGPRVYDAGKRRKRHALVDAFQTPADRPLQFVNETTYTNDPTILSHQSTREWIHSLSAVLGGSIEAGLTITMFREHDVLPWQGLPILVPASDRLWRLPDGYPRIPLSYSLRAKKIA
jgi:hypothetical protein